jgi:polysaccharide deacetylase family protein (PEP-CTERM system associated)
MVCHALTVDLEEWYHGIELPEQAWPSDSRLHVGLDRLLGLLDHHRVSATFFVLGVVADRFPRLIADLASSGHEIACHGHRHRLVYEQSPEEFRDDIASARDAVGGAAGCAPSGYRAPYFSIRSDSLWALDILAEQGFSYDSSIFPVSNYRYGIPDAPVSPHLVPTPFGQITELPLTPLRVATKNVPFSGGAYLRILPWSVQRVAWTIAERGERPLIAYIHPWELDPDHPRIKLPWRIAATHYARLRLTERRLDRLLSQHAFGRLDRVFSGT